MDVPFSVIVLLLLPPPPRRLSPLADSRSGRTHVAQLAKGAKEQFGPRMAKLLAEAGVRGIVQQPAAQISPRHGPGLGQQWSGDS
jgi:hypothetical protein